MLTSLSPPTTFPTTRSYHHSYHFLPVPTTNPITFYHLSYHPLATWIFLQPPCHPFLSKHFRPWKKKQRSSPAPRTFVVSIISFSHPFTSFYITRSSSAFLSPVLSQTATMAANPQPRHAHELSTSFRSHILLHPFTSSGPLQPSFPLCSSKQPPWPPTLNPSTHMCCQRHFVLTSFYILLNHQVLFSLPVPCALPNSHHGRQPSTTPRT